MKALRICAWCGTVMGVAETTTGEPTHGICDECVAKLEQEDASMNIIDHERFITHESGRSLAGAVAKTLSRQAASRDLQAIGAGAVNQATKALATANAYLKDDGIKLVTSHEWIEVVINDDLRTAMWFHVQPEEVMAQEKSAQCDRTQAQEPRKSRLIADSVPHL
jgi:stage V sporulation protein S